MRRRETLPEKRGIFHIFSSLTRQKSCYDWRGGEGGGRRGLCARAYYGPANKLSTGECRFSASRVYIYINNMRTTHVKYTKDNRAYIYDATVFSI